MLLLPGRADPLETPEVEKIHPRTGFPVQVSLADPAPAGDGRHTRGAVVLDHPLEVGELPVSSDEWPLGHRLHLIEKWP